MEQKSITGNDIIDAYNTEILNCIFGPLEESSPSFPSFQDKNTYESTFLQVLVQRERDPSSSLALLPRHTRLLSASSVKWTSWNREGVYEYVQFPVQRNLQHKKSHKLFQYFLLESLKALFICITVTEKSKLQTNLMLTLVVFILILF